MRKPARHVVMSFVSADDATAAVLRLYELGLASADIASYTPAQMRARAAVVLDRACPPAPPGLEPELVITQRALARLGHSFVLVRCSSESLFQRIGRIATETHAHSVRSSPTGFMPAASARRSARPIAPMANSAPTGRWQTAARPSTAA